jgi:uncharacterized protein involved in outer membrane biogenesis
VLKKLVVVVAALVVVLGILVSRDWDSPELGRKILAEVSAASGVDIEAEGFRLNLLRGLVLEKVRMTSQKDGRKLDIGLDRLVFEHRLAPLLSGTVAVDRIVLEKPAIEVTEADTVDGSTATPAETGAASEPVEPVESESDRGSGFSIAIREIHIEDGTVVMKNAKGEEKTRIEALDFEMADVRFDPSVASLAALSGKGSLAVGEMRFDALPIRDTEGEFELADAVFVVPELSFATPHGKFLTDARFDFRAVPFTYELEGQGDPLDVNSMVGAKEGFGPGTLQIDAKGKGPETKDLKAQGELQLAEGRFPAVSMFSQIDEALGKKVVEGASYKATHVSVRLENNRVTLAPFRFETESARLDLEGQVNLDGPIDFDLSLATPREGLEIEGAGATTLDLLVDDEGWVPVPIAITGSMEDPKVRPDVKALASQAGKGVKREATEKATEALGGLLKGRKKQN